jgi:hypothetical protein
VTSLSSPEFTCRERKTSKNYEKHATPRKITNSKNHENPGKNHEKLLRIAIIGRAVEGIDCDLIVRCPEFTCRQRKITKNLEKPLRIASLSTIPVPMKSLPVR